MLRPGLEASPPAGAHNDIVIENNHISNTKGKDIWVTSTKGLVLRNNICAAADVHVDHCLDVQTDIPASAQR